MLNKKGIAVDDTFPLLVVIVLFVIVIAAVFISGTSKDKNNQEDVMATKNNLKVIGTINRLLDEEITCGNNNAKIIDMLATLNEDEDEEMECLKKEIEKHFGEDDLWGLEVRGSNGRLFSAGDPISTGYCLPSVYRVYTIELPYSKLIFDWC